MRIYTVHNRPWANDDAVFVKEGFCWPAAFLTVIWALWHRMWWTALALAAAQVALYGALELLGLNEAGVVAFDLGVFLMVGLFANDWRRASLARRGYVMTTLVSGPGLSAAERRYFETAA